MVYFYYTSCFYYKKYNYLFNDKNRTLLFYLLFEIFEFETMATNYTSPIRFQNCGILLLKSEIAPFFFTISLIRRHLLTPNLLLWGRKIGCLYQFISSSSLWSLYFWIRSPLSLLSFKDVNSNFLSLFS